VTLLGGSACGMPFRKVLVKTRASASFTAELKDFVGPFDFFLAPRVNILTETPNICASGGIAEVYVSNPVPSSVYEWYTPNGHIISGTTGTTIYVDMPGQYIVRQYLQAGCSVYASDTVNVNALPVCGVLASDILSLRGIYADQQVRLNWKTLNNDLVQYFEVQRSTDGKNFVTIDRVNRTGSSEYSSVDEEVNINLPASYYRILMYSAENKVKYSNSITISLEGDSRSGIKLFPNPVKETAQLQINASSNSKAQIRITDAAGRVISSLATVVQQGRNVIVLDQLEKHPRGIYMLTVYLDGEVFNNKIILTD
jgi:hypothetical protein